MYTCLCILSEHAEYANVVNFTRGMSHWSTGLQLSDRNYTSEESSQINSEGPLISSVSPSFDRKPDTVDVSAEFEKNDPVISRTRKKRNDQEQFLKTRQRFNDKRKSNSCFFDKNFFLRYFERTMSLYKSRYQLLGGFKFCQIHHIQNSLDKNTNLIITT